jgi:proline iminopeptidase
MRTAVLLVLCSLALPGCRQRQGADHGSRIQDSVPIHSQEYLNLGGEDQYVVADGNSPDLPVLLFLHGGPGWPQTPQLAALNAGLSKPYIVVSWDQRGCGLSYMKDSAAPNMSLEQIVADAHELTAILKGRFHKEKIWLAGFSWGSIVGITLAQRYPEDYTAYVAISQVVNMKEGMRLTQDWLKAQALARMDKATLSTLVRLGKRDTTLCRGDLGCFIKQYELITPYNGAVYDTSTQAAVDTAMTTGSYKNYDWNKGFEYSATRLEKDMFAADFRKLDSFPIPVFFLSGRHDWNVPQVLTEELYQRLKAPYKEQIWFEKSGHGPLEEEPTRFSEVLASLTEKIGNGKK